MLRTGYIQAQVGTTVHLRKRLKCAESSRWPRLQTRQIWPAGHRSGLSVYENGKACKEAAPLRGADNAVNSADRIHGPPAVNQGPWRAARSISKRSSHRESSREQSRLVTSCDHSQILQARAGQGDAGQGIAEKGFRLSFA